MVATAFERSSQANSDRLARALARAVAGSFSLEELASTAVTSLST